VNPEISPRTTQAPKRANSASDAAFRSAATFQTKGRGTSGKAPITRQPNGGAA